jgi:hypothetical protein
MIYVIELSPDQRDALRDQCACNAEMAEKHLAIEPQENIWAGLRDLLDAAESAI